MKAIEATITSKGQLTVPAALRKALGLKAGDKLVFTRDAEGRFVVDARTDALADLRGIVGSDAPGPVSGAQVKNWIAESRTDRWRRAGAADEDGTA
ncbi:AbrB/MazE/SpoVT family DNA-binding domain-containing protein [Methylobacterium sp. NEAU 140]|uniref:AbrB/MazE/SpoVT family DNA-binding domain-containing protein n=1 Tax=Methylobacterium sp. NEAU 140 TaxID=3064945 RepID=UPI002736B8F5|nr:AbrB/MazE/SpoVT family DNA-binding domain-containing protein [Methylobacterium sp. NEAU 140]MDP4024805.1 AbrB/MazE/SpoVT family DNA-binding domain-containing protein [Methylobacterium sp. NEAU 140]